MSGNCPNCGAPKRDVYSWDGEVVMRIPQTPNVQVVINHDRT